MSENCCATFLNRHMLRPGLVYFLYRRILRRPRYLPTDEGITPMNSHKWIPHAVAPAAPDPMGRATRGILILALALGGVAADVAALSGPGGHASALQPGGS